MAAARGRDVPAKIRRRGNGQGVRVPKNVLVEARLQGNDPASRAILAGRRKLGDAEARNMLNTPLTNRLAVEHPVICAGMGGATLPELATAVSNAGGLGQVTVTGLTATMAAERVRRTLQVTGRPFAVNVILDIWKGHEVDAALAAGAPAIFLFWGDPAPLAQRIRAAGATLIVQVGSVDEAAAAAQAGADVFVAQGFEAGGHVRGTTPLVSLVPLVVEAVAPIPVVAAGGLVDGRGLAAALALGADGVLMGTRFLAAEEAFVHAEYRRRLLESTGETFYSADCFDVAWSNAPHRVLRNRVVDEWEAAGRPPLGNRAGEGSIIGRSRASDRVVEIERYTSFMATPAFEGDIDEVPLWAGVAGPSTRSATYPCQCRSTRRPSAVPTRPTSRTRMTEPAGPGPPDRRRGARPTSPATLGTVRDGQTAPHEHDSAARAGPRWRGAIP